jgi:hypothetical protein
MKQLLLSLIILTFITSCDHSDKKDDNREYYDSNISSIIFERKGGGDIKYETIPDENGYKIIVTRYEDNFINYEINLSNDYENVFNYVKNIFNKNIDLYDEVYIPSGLTGTFPSVTLIYETHETVTISCVNLALLGDFVRNKIALMK